MSFLPLKDVLDWREPPRGQVLEIQGRPRAARGEGEGIQGRPRAAREGRGSIQGRPRAAKGGGGEAFKDVPEWRERAFKDVPEWREGPISFHKFCCIFVFIFIYFQIFFDILVTLSAMGTNLTEIRPNRFE